MIGTSFPVCILDLALTFAAARVIGYACTFLDTHRSYITLQFLWTWTHGYGHGHNLNKFDQHLGSIATTYKFQ
ncbi:hypothetical protein C8Q70DRAFT_611530 [Cubamyces menziesii]|nr:hypothetical protein C8Q70DRAFT_611530 [Cubamyces menziesii]